jgi:RNA polymerase sigma-70 factor (ECF subfamily)
MDLIDDTALAARLADDLDAAFEVLVRGHIDRLYSIALRLTGDRHDAEEVAQDALVRAYRALTGYEPARIRALRLRPWLATIAANLARNRRRRIIDRQPPLSLAAAADDGPTPLVSPTASPEALATESLERDRWAALLGALPDRYRVPLVLRHVDDLSYAEMSEALGRSEGTLKSQVHRGLVLLRAAWDAAEREEAIA